MVGTMERRKKSTSEESTSSERVLKRRTRRAKMLRRSHLQFWRSRATLSEFLIWRKRSKPKKRSQASQTEEPEKREDVSRVVAPKKAPSHLKLKNSLLEFLGEFYRKYGSFFPFQRINALTFLQVKFRDELDISKEQYVALVTQCLLDVSQSPVTSFRVVYKRHVLTLSDLTTLTDDNWLNDQVINMYGDLLVDSARQKVYFFNSFFYPQLVTKGYKGVKRWTKNVDLFSYSLVLVPIHLVIHWCLVAINMEQKKICLCDSQGQGYRNVSKMILEYLVSEAKEKKRKEFEYDWTLMPKKRKTPLQTNDNDCGVFALEYSKCFVFKQNFRFTQKDIPTIRKRIYRQLCDGQLYRR